MSTNILSVPAMVKYDGSLSVEPENLIKFSDEYKERHIPQLLAFIKEHIGEKVELSFVRMKRDGSLARKVVSCNILKLIGDRFIISTTESLDSNIEYDDSRQILVRTDNVLGAVPMLLLETGTDIEPFEADLSIATLDYFGFLNEAIELMKSCVGLDNASTFLWRYGKFFPKGNFFTEGKIVKVNESNVEYDCVRICTPEYTDIIPHLEIDRFMAPDRYLQGFKTRLGEKHQVNPSDDE